MQQLQPTPSNRAPGFRDARRIQQSFLASLEKRTLIWLAARTPAWINSDHLTLLGLLSMAGAGASYWWSHTNRLGLLLVIVCLALNWLGDSLDGTLARFRDHSRPRYGFYVDHIVDAFSALFLLGGLALSGYMSPLVALGLLVAYLMLSVEVYLASYTLGDFKISYFKMGPTELRLLLSIGNLVLYFWKSTVHALGRVHKFFDVAGTIGISGMLLIMVISAVHNTLRLYRQEPIPSNKQDPAQKCPRMVTNLAPKGKFPLFIVLLTSLCAAPQAFAHSNRQVSKPACCHRNDICARSPCRSTIVESSCPIGGKLCVSYPRY